MKSAAPLAVLLLAMWGTDAARDRSSRLRAPNQMPNNDGADENCELVVYRYKTSEFNETYTATGTQFYAPLYGADDNDTQVGVYSAELNYFGGDHMRVCTSTSTIGIDYDPDLDNFQNQVIVQGFCGPVGDNSGNPIIGGSGIFENSYGHLDYWPTTNLVALALRVCTN